MKYISIKKSFKVADKIFKKSVSQSNINFAGFTANSIMLNVDVDVEGFLYAITVDKNFFFS